MADISPVIVEPVVDFNQKMNNISVNTGGISIKHSTTHSVERVDMEFKLDKYANKFNDTLYNLIVESFEE